MTQQTLRVHVVQCDAPPPCIDVHTHARRRKRPVGVRHRARKYWTAVAVERHLKCHPDVPLRLLSIDHVTFYAEYIAFGCTFLNDARERCIVMLSLNVLLPHYPMDVQNALQRTHHKIEAQLHPDV